MFKKMKIVLLLVTSVLLLASCATPTVEPTAEVVPSTPVYIIITATTSASTEKVASSTSVPATKPPLPAKTSTKTIPGAYDQAGTPVTSASSIIITNIQDASSGQAQIFWNATGTFAGGFRIYYSTSNANPYIGGGFSEYSVIDGLTRSAYITGTPGTTYYYRICSYTGSACEFYSNSYTFKFAATP